MESVQATPPNCRILNNSPALRSLKRQQLVQLCKRNGIKASGKNTELIERLKSHASDMSDVSPGDGDKENKRMPLSRPSEAWSVIDEDSREIKTVRMELKNIQEEVEQEMPTQSTLRGFGGSSFNEYNSGSTNSKNSTITSSFKLLANSLKKVGNKMSTGPAQTSFPPMSVDELATIEKIPELTTPIKTRPSPLPSPATGNEDDTRDVSIRDLGESTIRLVSTATSVPSPPALRPFTPTFEACYSPESRQVSPSRSRMVMESPFLPGAFPETIPTSPKPLLQPAAPPSFVFGSPAHQASNTQFHSAAASVLAEMNARLGYTGTSNEVGINILEKKNTQPSVSTTIFSQIDKPKTDITHKFDKAHEQQFQQMEGIGDWYARKHGKAAEIPNKKRKSDALAGPNKRVVRPSQGRRSSRGQAPRVVSQTVDEHSEERQAKRAKISFVDKPGTIQIRENVPEHKVDNKEGVDVDNALTEAEREKERNAIKKRLEVSRARRRSSMGRVSVGANKPALIPNQPKKGIATRFGFLSSAKNLVKNVWNRGVGAGPQKEEPKPKSAVPVPIQKKDGSGSITSTKTGPAKKLATFAAPAKSNGSQPAKKLSIRSSTVSTNGANPSRTSTISSVNAGSHRAAIPSFSRISAVGRTNSLIRKEGSNVNNNTNGTHRSQGGSANSIGFKHPGSIPTVGSTRTSEVSNLSTAARKRTSTLLAPTASSLARMHQTVKPPSLSAKTTANPASTMKATSDPAPTPSRIPTLSTATPRQVSGKEDDKAIERTPGTIFATGPPSFSPAKPAVINEAAPKPRPLPGRRPRISRSRVIARVGAQRIASQPEKINPNNGRRSLNAAKTRGSLGVRVSGIGSKAQTRESLANHRRRLRQSEIVRRRSKMSSIGAVAPGTRALEHDVSSADEMEED